MLYKIYKRKQNNCCSEKKTIVSEDSEEEMIEAAKKARCHDFIMELPDGYDTVIGEGGGTVTGAYAGSNSSFASGDRINVNQSVVLTAKPAEGYAVKYWSCDGEIIKAENGVDNYTGLTYTVTGISKTTTYFVAFEKVETAEVKVTFVDKDGYPFLGASVNINGEDLSGDENIFKVLHVYGNGKEHISRAVIHAVSPGEAVLTAKYDGKVVDTINVKIYR